MFFRKVELIEEERMEKKWAQLTTWMNGEQERPRALEDKEEANEEETTEADTKADSSNGGGKGATFKPKPKPKADQSNKGGKGTGGKGKGGKGNRDYSHVQCHDCGEYGHIGRQCLYKKGGKGGYQPFQVSERALAAKGWYSKGKDPGKGGGKGKGKGGKGKGKGGKGKGKRKGKGKHGGGKGFHNHHFHCYEDDWSWPLYSENEDDYWYAQYYDDSWSSWNGSEAGAPQKKGRGA